jgi:hypothetical protein
LSGIGAHVGKGMGVAIADYDSNGFMHILAGNDNEQNFIFRRTAEFTEAGVEAAVAYNEDGRPDVVITALGGESFPLFINAGNGYSRHPITNWESAF